MFEQSFLRWVLGAGGLALLLVTVLTWWLPAYGGTEIEAPAELVARLQQAAPENSAPLLTELYDRLAPNSRVRQVVLLQAVPARPPIVIAAMEDSSDDEGATHWPSPWLAVNAALDSGRLAAACTVAGRHAGFDCRHTLVPLDETHSRVLLINQSAPARSWSSRRLLALLAACLLITLATARPR